MEASFVSKIHMRPMMYKEWSKINLDFSYIDKAFINASVITVNASDEIAEAVGIKGNKIVFVGSTAELMTIADEKTKIIDVKGRTLCPGFIDSHFHPILVGLIGDSLDSGIVNIFYPKGKSLKELLDKVREVASLKKPGEWISMMGYEPLLLEEKRHPTLEELDEAAPDNPLHFMHGGGHICKYNSKALAYLGVFGPEDALKFPKDEVEVVDGKLTGLVRGHTHFKLWGKVTYTEEQQARAAMSSHAKALSYGVTSVHDCGELDKPSYHIMQKLCRDRTFKIRIYMMLHSIFGKEASKKDNEHWLSLGLMSGLGDDYFKIGGGKFMIDGGSGAPSCATREPYSHDPDLPGEWGWEREEGADYLEYLHQEECQATAHAIGDMAVEFMVEGYEKLYEKELATACNAILYSKGSWNSRLRHRIEHCSLVDQDLIDRMAKMGICPTLNPGMLTSIGANYTKFYGERMKYMIAARSMLDAGVPVAFASDNPSGPMGMALIDGAVNRYDRVQGVELDQTQCISVLEAIRCATYGSAYAAKEEDIKGSLEVGKLADLIILSENILTLPKEKLNEVQVDLTVIDGNIEYERIF